MERYENGKEKTENAGVDPAHETSVFTSLHKAFAVQEQAELTQLFGTYILVPSSQNFLLVHQQAAHERIIYERLAAGYKRKTDCYTTKSVSGNVELAPADTVILNELLPDLQQMGYIIEPFGKDSFVIQGSPADIEGGNEKNIIEKVLEQYKHFSYRIKIIKTRNVIAFSCCATSH